VPFDFDPRFDPPFFDAVPVFPLLGRLFAPAETSEVGVREEPACFLGEVFFFELLPPERLAAPAVGRVLRPFELRLELLDICLVFWGTVESSGGETAVAPRS
jgi:hypothetical protein